MWIVATERGVYCGILFVWHNQYYFCDIEKILWLTKLKVLTGEKSFSGEYKQSILCCSGDCFNLRSGHIFRRKDIDLWLLLRRIFFPKNPHSYAGTSCSFPFSTVKSFAAKMPDFRNMQLGFELAVTVQERRLGAFSENVQFMNGTIEDSILRVMGKRTESKGLLL